jgi:hypothetical protein
VLGQRRAHRRPVTVPQGRALFNVAEEKSNRSRGQFSKVSSHFHLPFTVVGNLVS